MALEHGMIEPFEDRQVRAGRGLVRRLVVRLRLPRRQRVQGVHQRLQHGGGSQEIRSAVVRRHQGRLLHRAAEFVRPGVDGGILPHSARRPDGVPWQVHLRPLRHHRQRDAVRAGVGRARHDRDFEHHAAAGEDLRQRGHRPGVVLPERRAVRDFLQGQEGQVPGATRRHASEDLNR